MNLKDTKFTKEDEKILLLWKNTKQLRPKTFNTYKGIIKHYTIATSMTLTELYEEALHEEETHVPRYRKSIKTHIIEFQEYLDNNTKLKENTKCIYTDVIKSFYNSLDIEVPLIKNNYDDQPVTSTYHKMLTKELIRLMMDTADARDKAIINFALMTGQAVQEISNLTIQDIINAWNTTLEQKIFNIDDIFKYKKNILDIQIVPLEIKRQKTNNRYWVYIPSETSRHIIEYLYERTAGRNTKTRINNTSDPLFVTKVGDKMATTTVGKVFDTVGKRCGFEQPELWDDETRLLLERSPGEQRVYSCHKFRKYFMNMCRRHAGTNSETPSEHVYGGKELGDFWLGHQEKGSMSNYLQYNEDDVHELGVHYLQVLPYLSCEVEVETLTTSDKREFLEMKEKYIEIKEELEEFKEYVRQKQKLDVLAKKYGLE